jgi:hypothetical protein
MRHLTAAQRLQFCECAFRVFAARRRTQISRGMTHKPIAMGMIWTFRTLLNQLGIHDAPTMDCQLKNVHRDKPLIFSAIRATSGYGAAGFRQTLGAARKFLLTIALLRRANLHRKCTGAALSLGPATHSSTGASGEIPAKTAVFYSLLLIVSTLHKWSKCVRAFRVRIAIPAAGERHGATPGRLADR